ncbi:MAG: helix-hairpin-helix domain-containing protein, partial [Bacteroidia bacterium]
SEVKLEHTTEVKNLEEKIKRLTQEKNVINERLSECYARRIKLEKEVNDLNVRLLKQKDDSVMPEESAVVMSSTPISESDDLKRIEGIGPKIEQLLNGGGIKSYKDVINASVEEIKAVLITAGPTYAVHDPSTWGEQAELAEANNWDKLKELQEELKGGKRL